MRNIWKGALSFGLIHIPVRLYSASRERELKFKLLHKQDLSEIRYARICKTDGKEVPWEDIVKGYELDDGDVVVLTEEDFTSVNPAKTKTIDITDFSIESEIDTVYYDKPYYLEPEKGAEHAYVLLREALKKSQKVAIGRYVLRQHENLGVIKPYGDLLVLNKLRYPEEMINPEEINVPQQAKIPKKEVDIALKFIDQMTTAFDPEAYEDTYSADVKAMIKKKAKGERKHVKKPKEVPSTKVHDIMALLKKSVTQSQKKKRRKTA